MSVIVPAFNEEALLPAALRSIRESIALLESKHGLIVELIVVDNNSTDATAATAASFGAVVVFEPERNIARARNRGAAMARGEVLVFIDADTLIPDEALPRIYGVTSSSACLGGAIDTEYRARKTPLSGYLGLWRVVGRIAHLAQGAAQFCRRDAFAALGGYDEHLFIGEDVDFYSRLRKYARETKTGVCFVDDLHVTPSTRRFDQWPLWRTLLWTNPFVIAGLRRVRSFWKGWYHNPPR